MYCKNCGTKSNDGEKFCTSCGNSFSHRAEPGMKQDIEYFPRKTKKSFWDPGRIIGIIIVLGLITVGAYNSQDKEVIDKNNQALTSFDSGNSEQAIIGFKEASQNANSNENKLSTLKNLAYVYSTENKNDLALSTFKEAFSLTSPDSFDYYLIAGEIAFLEKKFNSALIAYSKAYEKNPNNFQINVALTGLYLDTSDDGSKYTDYKKAVKYAKRAAELSELQTIKQNLGVAYYFNGDYQEAISTFKTVTLDADSFTAYFLGLSYIGNNDPVNAKIYLGKAIASGKVEIPQEVYDYINSH